MTFTYELPIGVDFERTERSETGMYQDYRMLTFQTPALAVIFASSLLAYAIAAQAKGGK